MPDVPAPEMDGDWPRTGMARPVEDRRQLARRPSSSAGPPSQAGPAPCPDEELEEAAKEPLCGRPQADHDHYMAPSDTVDDAMDIGTAQEGAEALFHRGRRAQADVLARDEC